MLMGMGIGLIIGWGVTKQIVTRWRRWWVALLAVAAVMVLLFCASVLVAILDGQTGPQSANRFVRAFGGVFWPGTIASIWTAISNLRTPKITPVYGSANDASRSRND